MDLEIRNADMSYPKIQKSILSNVNLSLDHAKVAVVGSNGSGKTTLIKGIMGLAEVRRGDVTIFDRSLKKIANILGIACNLDQVYRLLDVPIKQKMEMYCTITGLDPSPLFEHIERYSLSEILTKRTRELSTGQDKAFCNIMAMGLGYKLALLDEPFETLDVKRRLITIEDLKNFKGSLLINTHDFGAIKSLPDWDVYLIVDGKLYGKFNSSDINRLYLTEGEAAESLCVIRTDYGTFSVTMDRGDTPLSSSTDLVSSIQDVVQ